ncbi:DUF4349 domain-containing protein [Paenibacillus rubinfantis]|uniref:DUF4349 domain-containing protein n=1 Tax=Paenibacillus rubinfantis TaxID=1720296 RepID=UPI00073F2053|nr:DUF4349 domain-containing protein [Paenibacillus rubinfantis]
MGKRGKKVVIWGLIALLLLLLSGCGSASNEAASNTSFSSETTNSIASTAESDMDGGANAKEAADMAAAPAAGSGADSASAGDAGNGSTAVNTAPAFQPVATQTGLNSKLIYRASVVMEVKDYAKAQSEIRNLVTLAGGYIVEFSENQSQHELGGNFVLKVPATGFSSFLDRLEGLKPESLQRSIQGQDVSEEYVDLQSRLKVKQAMEARYLKFVEEATQTKQLVEFVNELERIQTEIEQIKGRMRYIDSNVSFSTIEIRVYQPDASKLAAASNGDTPLLERMKNALTGSIDVLSLFFQWLVVFAAGALPLLVIAALIVIPIWITRRKNRAERERRRAQLQAGQASLPGTTDNISTPQSNTQEDRGDASEEN